MVAGPTLFLSSDHLAAVGGMVVANVALCAAARRKPEAQWTRWFMRGLAACQVVNAAATHAFLVATDRWEARWALPCHLCDAAIAASVVCLLRPSPLAFELTYFWGLGGALQGLITPAIDVGFPDPACLQFFVVHVGLVTSAVFLAFGLGMRPRPGALLRTMLWTNACAAVAALASWLADGNYMFLREPPPTGSLLDYLGAWPWYVVVAEVVALLLFALLALPFRFAAARPA